MAVNKAVIAEKEPTFDLPSGGASDFYLVREDNNSESLNKGKILKRYEGKRYPYLTRRTGDSLVGTNEEMTSSELRHGRTEGKTKVGNASASGSHDFEFSPETLDDELEGTFRSKWVRFIHDGQKNLITKDFITPDGYIHVNGDDGTYNQPFNTEREGLGVDTVPLFYTADEAGTEDDPYGLIKISAENMGGVTRKAAVESGGSPFGKFVVHELHCENKPVKYGFISRIPINDDVVRYQHFKHVEIGEMNLNVTVNSIVTGSFNLNGSNNPLYYTENQEAGKTRMADKMAETKDVAIGTGKDFFSTDYTDAAERFIAAVRDNTQASNTDQFTALDGFLYINGHQLQFCSDLTMDLNNNLNPVNAIFVKNAIANLSPSLSISGNITAYFTDGELDATGKKYGADDLKNLAAQNKDTEIIFAFQDKEDPEVLYLFQIFKANISAPQESKNADSPITLELPFKSFGEMAVRCLRLAIPKVRDIEIDIDSILDSTDGLNSVSVTLYPNVPIDAEQEAKYTDSTSDAYIFKNVRVSRVIEGKDEEDNAASFSDVEINEDGSISATLNLSEKIRRNDIIKIWLNVNNESYEQAFEFVPAIPYIRMGKVYASQKYQGNTLLIPAGNIISLMEENDGTSSGTQENHLLYNTGNVTIDDVEITTSDKKVCSIENGMITAVSEGSAKITVKSKYNSLVKYSFNVTVQGSSSTSTEADSPTVSGLEGTTTVTAGDNATLTVNASVSDGGTLSYQWSKDGSEIAGAVSSSYIIENATTDDAGTYSVVVTNTLGSSTKSSSASTVVSVE